MECRADRLSSVLYRCLPYRLELPDSPVFIYEEKYAGEGAKHKIGKILNAAAGQGAEAAFVTALDEIAWALNLRGSDVAYNPVFAYTGVFELLRRLEEITRVGPKESFVRCHHKITGRTVESAVVLAQMPLRRHVFTLMRLQITCSGQLS